MPRERKLLIALAISLLIHGLVLCATGRWATGMPGEIDFAIEAHLAARGETVHHLGAIVARGADQAQTVVV
jgi:hypothetical protein